MQKPIIVSISTEGGGQTKGLYPLTARVSSTFISLFDWYKHFLQSFWSSAGYGLTYLIRNFWAVTARVWRTYIGSAILKYFRLNLN